MFDAGITALMGAVKGGHTELVRELLLQKGADVNAANANGEWRGSRRGAKRSPRMVDCSRLGGRGVIER
jgi:ankyrin repeat protein